jgi:hypothetical protein
MNWGVETIIYPVEVAQEVRDVGGGRLIASVRDADNNPIGLVQDP